MALVADFVDINDEDADVESMLSLDDLSHEILCSVVIIAIGFGINTLLSRSYGIVKNAGLVYCNTLTHTYLYKCAPINVHMRIYKFYTAKNRFVCVRKRYERN